MGQPTMKPEWMSLGEQAGSWPWQENRTWAGDCLMQRLSDYLQRTIIKSAKYTKAHEQVSSNTAEGKCGDLERVYAETMDLNLQQYDSMDEFDETYRKSQEASEKLKQFLAKKPQSSIEQTLKKIDKAESTLNSNQTALHSITQIYNKIEQKFDQQVNNAVISVQTSTSPFAADKDFQPKTIQSAQLVQLMKDSKKIMVLTGKQISESCGLPEFKGQNFYSKQQVEIDLQDDSFISDEVLLTSACFYERPKLVWKFVREYNQKKINTIASQGHYILNEILEELARAGKQVSLVTQNIDNFHQQVHEQSRSKNRSFRGYPIYDINGNASKIRCSHCSIQKSELQFEPYETYAFILEMQSRLYCPVCQGPLTPHILFNDQLSNQIFEHSETVTKLIQEADLLIVVGSTILPGLASSLIAAAAEGKKTIVEISQNCLIKKSNTLWMSSQIVPTLDSIKKILNEK